MINDPSGTILLHLRPELVVCGGKLNAYRHDGFWQAMNTFQKCQHLNPILNDRIAPRLVW
jgi:hypothetical protein